MCFDFLNIYFSLICFNAKASEKKKKTATGQDVDSEPTDECYGL